MPMHPPSNPWNPDFHLHTSSGVHSKCILKTRSHPLYTFQPLLNLQLPLFCIFFYFNFFTRIFLFPSLFLVSYKSSFHSPPLFSLNYWFMGAENESKKHTEVMAADTEWSNIFSFHYNPLTSFPRPQSRKKSLQKTSLLTFIIHLARRIYCLFFLFFAFFSCGRISLSY